MRPESLPHVYTRCLPMQMERALGRPLEEHEFVQKPPEQDWADDHEQCAGAPPEDGEEEGEDDEKKASEHVAAAMYNRVLQLVLYDRRTSSKRSFGCRLLAAATNGPTLHVLGG